MKQWRLILFGTLLLGLAAFGLVQPAHATEFRDGDTVTVAADEVIDDDLFISGQRVEVNGTVKGDLIAAGNDVVVNGVVEGSLLVAGQTLAINGDVDGSVYAAGYALTVGPEANVNRNLYVGGYSLTTEAGSSIGRSLYVGGYQALLSGEVARDVNVGSAALELNGAVGGDVHAEVGSAESGAAPSFAFPGSVPSVQPGFRQGEGATVSGTLDVRETTMPDDETAETGWPGLSDNVLQRVGHFIALLIVGGVLLYAWPNTMEQVSDTAQERPLPSAGRGFLILVAFFIGIPLAVIALILLAVLAGWLTFGQLAGPVALLGGSLLVLLVATFLVLFGLITKVIVSYLVGHLILVRANVKLASDFGFRFLSLAVGALLYEILRAVPFGFGWLVGLLVTIVGLGALYLMWQEGRQPPQKPDVKTAVA